MILDYDVLYSTNYFFVEHSRDFFKVIQQQGLLGYLIIISILKVYIEKMELMEL
jgi:hypothetical protein